MDGYNQYIVVCLISGHRINQELICGVVLQTLNRYEAKYAYYIIDTYTCIILPLENI